MKIKAYGICLYKIEKNTIKILLCQSVVSLRKWGCLKGVQEINEIKQQTARREFFEESSIEIPIELLTNYFEQINDEKDIGIYLVNASKIKYIDKYFYNNILLDKYLSNENKEVKFFDINNLPIIKKKQYTIIQNIIKVLTI